MFRRQLFLRALKAFAQLGELGRSITPFPSSCLYTLAPSALLRIKHVSRGEMGSGSDSAHSADLLKLLRVASTRPSPQVCSLYSSDRERQLAVEQQLGRIDERLDDIAGPLFFASRNPRQHVRTAQRRLRGQQPRALGERPERLCRQHRDRPLDRVPP